MTGWKDWTVGEVVTEPDFQSFIQNQVVQVYADSTARGTALGTAVSEGMISYLEDTNAVEYYSGSAWVGVSNPGDITAVTAGTGLTGGGSTGDVTLDIDYAAVGSAVTINATQIDHTLTSSTATAYTVATADANTVLRFTNASAVVTLSTATAFSAGERVDIVDDGGGLTVTNGTGTYLGGAGTAGTVTFSVGDQFSAVTVLALGSDAYRIIGNITVV